MIKEKVGSKYYVSFEHPASQTKEEAESKDQVQYATLVINKKGEQAYCVLKDDYWHHCNLYDNHKPEKRFCHKDDAIKWRGLTGFDY